MKKIVSNDKYTLFFEKNNKDDINCVAYETGKHMSVEEIGEELGISIVCARNHLKKAIRKIYNRMKITHKDLSTCDIFHSMAMVFNVNCTSEYRQFLRLFPDNIRSEIYYEASK